MPSLGGAELLFLLVLALLLLGPEGMIETVRAAGRLTRALRRAWEELDDAMRIEDRARLGAEAAKPAESAPAGER